MSLMQKLRIVRWKEKKAWLGYLRDYPDYWTQGKTREDLYEHLLDLYRELAGGEIPSAREAPDP